VSRWIFPPEVTGPEPREVDDRDLCQACNGTVDTCVCSDLVTPHPSEL
jgi:hypothetical protein